MDVFDPGGVEGRDGSLPDETGSRQSLCTPLLGASQPCQDERHLAKLLPSVLLSLVSKQTLSIFNR